MGELVPRPLPVGAAEPITWLDEIYEWQIGSNPRLQDRMTYLIYLEVLQLETGLVGITRPKPFRIVYVPHYFSAKYQVHDCVGEAWWVCGRFGSFGDAMAYIEGIMNLGYNERVAFQQTQRAEKFSSHYIVADTVLLGGAHAEYLEREIALTKAFEHDPTSEVDLGMLGMV